MVSHKWVPNAVVQVTKSNFIGAFQQLKAHIRESDYIAISSQKTGGGSALWHRVLPIDTPQISYLKCKLAAETYEVFQFAVCPFKFDGSNVVAFPYFLFSYLNSFIPLKSAKSQLMDVNMLCYSQQL